MGFRCSKRQKEELARHSLGSIGRTVRLDIRQTADGGGDLEYRGNVSEGSMMLFQAVSAIGYSVVRTSAVKLNHGVTAIQPSKRANC